MLQQGSEHVELGGVRVGTGPDALVSQVQSCLRDPEVRVVTFGHMPTDEEAVLFQSLSRAFDSSVWANITPPYDDVSLREKLADLFAAYRHSHFPALDALLNRFMFLHGLFRTIAESAEDVLCYGMIGGNGHVLDFPWHVDRVALSLVDTVLGPGTLWARESDVIRSRFADGYIPDIGEPPPVKAGAETVSFAPGSIAIFKGELRADHAYPDVQRGIRHRGGRELNRGRGLVHASPLLATGERRIFFSVFTFLAPSYMSDAP